MSEIFSTAVSAGLLQVLAEAAAGYTDPEQHYFVASYGPGPDGTYDLYGPYENELSANDWEQFMNAQFPGQYATFGPFQTSPPFPVNPNQQSVQSFEVTPTPPAEGGPGSDKPFTIGGTDQYDALFCSAAAVMKFAVPYYTQVYSPDFANQALEAFGQAQLGLMAHLPWSEYGMVQEGGGLQTPGRQDSVRRGPDEAAAPGDAAPEQAGGGIRRWMPVVFGVDEHGNFKPQPIYPPRP